MLLFRFLDAATQITFFLVTAFAANIFACHVSGSFLFDLFDVHYYLSRLAQVTQHSYNL